MHSSPSYLWHAEQVHTHAHSQLWNHWCKSYWSLHLEIGIIVSQTHLTTPSYFCNQSLYPYLWCEPIPPGHLFSQSFACDVSRHLMMSPDHSTTQLLRYTQQIALIHLSSHHMHSLWPILSNCRMNLQPPLLPPHTLIIMWSPILLHNVKVWRSHYRLLLPSFPSRSPKPQRPRFWRFSHKLPLVCSLPFLCRPPMPLHGLTSPS